MVPDIPNQYCPDEPNLKLCALTVQIIIWAALRPAAVLKIMSVVKTLRHAVLLERDVVWMRMVTISAKYNVKHCSNDLE